MLIAQVTDVHIGFERDDPEELNVRRLRAVLERLVHGPNRPDLLLLSGDLTEMGDARSYARLADLVASCPFPVWPMTGNHDARAPLLAAFPQARSADGFVQYAIDLAGLRILALDTLDAGHHGGAFCAARADWLHRQLTADATTPTWIAMHHPPFESGIDWLDSDARAPWIARFADTIRGFGQVRGIVAGHLHRAIHTQWNGLALSVCPSIAPAVGLDLTPVDPNRPDGRELIVKEPPGYALHYWNGTAMITHVEAVGDQTVLARFDHRLQPMIRGLAAEKAR